MSGYTKLFSDIIESSIWNEPPDTCKVWITLLALSDKDGYVRGSVGWLAGKARVSKEKCAAAITLFQQPDDESRTADHEGRRIEQMDDGWLILNYLKFRDRLSTDATATATRIRVQKHRERYKALRNTKEALQGVTALGSASASVSVTTFQEGSPGGRFTLDDCLKAAAPIGMKREDVEEFYHRYNRQGWRFGNGAPVVNLHSALATWKTGQPSRGKSYREPQQHEEKRSFTSL